MYCNQCGNKLDSNSSFCSKCGKGNSSNASKSPVSTVQMYIIIATIAGLLLTATIILGLYFGYYKPYLQKVADNKVYQKAHRSIGQSFLLDNGKEITIKSVEIKDTQYTGVCNSTSRSINVEVYYGGSLDSLSIKPFLNNSNVNQAIRTNSSGAIHYDISVTTDKHYSLVFDDGNMVDLANATYNKLSKEEKSSSNMFSNVIGAGNYSTAGHDYCKTQ